jgi:hypothetical protein
MYGQRIGYEQVEQTKIGESLRRYVYVLKFERGLHDEWKVYTWQMSRPAGIVGRDAVDGRAAAG